ncbi:MAG: lysylphosphatidylglycerol synthase domain-containing protein [bacterium]
MKNPLKVGKILNRLIQFVILVGTYLFMYKQIFHKTNLPGLIKTLEDDFSKPGFISQLSFVVLLMFVNWSLESLKWQLLIRKIENISFFKSVQAVLTGVSVSSFTPNRIGEYLGRVFILRKASHIEGILITILGSMCQLMVTIVAGSTTFLIFLPRYFSNTIYANGYMYYGLIFLILLLDLLLIGLLFNLSFISNLKKLLFRDRLKKFQEHLKVLSFYKGSEILIVILLSSLRYLIFSSQFYLLLRLFGIEVPVFDALMLISMIYFIMAVIPTIALTELGIRGSVAIYFFGMYLSRFYPVTPEMNLGIFSASTLLWMINLGIPALAGTIFVFRLQFFRKSNTK